MKDFLTDFIWAIAAIQVLLGFLLSGACTALVGWLAIIKLLREVHRAKEQPTKRVSDIQTAEEARMFREG